MQGSFIQTMNAVRKFKTYKEEERQTYGKDKAKKTKEKRKQKRTKREVWEELV